MPWNWQKIGEWTMSVSVSYWKVHIRSGWIEKMKDKLLSYIFVAIFPTVFWVVLYWGITKMLGLQFHMLTVGSVAFLVFLFLSWVNFAFTSGKD